LVYIVYGKRNRGVEGEGKTRGVSKRGSGSVRNQHSTEKNKKETQEREKVKSRLQNGRKYLLFIGKGEALARNHELGKLRQSKRVSREKK